MSLSRHARTLQGLARHTSLPASAIAALAAREELRALVASWVIPEEDGPEVAATLASRLLVAAANGALEVGHQRTEGESQTGIILV